MSGDGIRSNQAVPGSLWRLKQPACENLKQARGIFRRPASEPWEQQGWNRGWERTAAIARWRYDIGSRWLLISVTSLVSSAVCDCQFMLPNGQLTLVRFDADTNMADCLELVE